jgi:16S rRNA (cytidine1402-2'-O)-methyltransferase
VVKGEITIVVAGCRQVRQTLSDEEILARAGALINGEGESLSRRDAATMIAEETGEPRRRIYNLLMN